MTLLRKIYRKIFGDPYAKKLKPYEPMVHKINAFEHVIEKLGDEELRAKTAEFRARLAKNETLDQILADTYL